METGMTAQKSLVAMTALVIAASASAQSPPSPTGPVTIVLVHGALIDGSSWRGVFDVLTRDGYHVSVAQSPLSGLEEDVAAKRRLIDQLDGPVILVGNSYGGSIITVAGSDPKVKALVYVAALRPDVGETSAEVAPPKTQATNDLRQTKTDSYWHDQTLELWIEMIAAPGSNLPKVPT
jgi:pimeloyl-ACP methyl ester carboxylesterase